MLPSSAVTGRAGYGPQTQEMLTAPLLSNANFWKLGSLLLSMHLIGKKMHLTKKLCKCCFFKIEKIKFRLSECVLERRMRAYSRAQDYLGFLCLFNELRVLWAHLCHSCPLERRKRSACLPLPSHLSDRRLPSRPVCHSPPPFPLKLGNPVRCLARGLRVRASGWFCKEALQRMSWKKKKKVTLNHPTHCQICAQRGIARIHAVCPLQDYKYASALRCGSI